MELLDIVTPEGEVIGYAPRERIHGDNTLLHCVVHVLVFDSSGRLLLQKRSMKKDVAAGLWDTSVGGHVDKGEEIEDAVLREMEEELGITGIVPEFLYHYIHSNDYESELVHTYRCIYDGNIRFNPEEIDEVRYFELSELDLFKDSLSDNFRHELKTFLEGSQGGKTEPSPG